MDASICAASSPANNKGTQSPDCICHLEFHEHWWFHYTQNRKAVE